MKVVFQVERIGQTKVEAHIKAWFVNVMERGKLRESNRKFLKSILGRGKGRVIAPVLLIF